jgi:hypothetical protein
LIIAIVIQREEERNINRLAFELKESGRDTAAIVLLEWERGRKKQQLMGL